jgi:hypothetical protein
MITPGTLAPCPHCGVLLTKSLVAAIADPKQDESCPSAPAQTEPAEWELASRRLIAYAMLGRVAERRTVAS